MNNGLLTGKKVIPYFQPIVDGNKKIVKYEALMKIVHPQDNKQAVSPPNEFLKKSINNDLYLGDLKNTLKTTLRYFSNREEKISINFLPDDFFNLIIMNDFLEELKKFDFTNRVIVEISEKQCIQNFSKLLKIVKKLKEIGVLLSINDFDGTYAENAYILILKPDFIKIKSTLIKNISNGSDSKNKVQNIIKFAKEFDIKIVADFVEDEDLFNLLQEYGVDEFQGYYFGYPVDLINKA